MVSGGIEYRLKGEELDDDVCYLRGTTLPACVPTTYTVPVHRTTPLTTCTSYLYNLLIINTTTTTNIPCAIPFEHWRRSHSKPSPSLSPAP